MVELNDLSIARRLINTKTSADKRGLEFNLSFQKLKRILTTKRCFFTGVLLDREDAESENYLTLDRLDASKGYTDDNVVACAKSFNFRKGNITVSDIELMYKKLKQKGFIK